MKSPQLQIAWFNRLQIIMALAMIVAIAAFYFLGHRPIARKMAALSLQIEGKQRDLAQNQNKAKYLPLLAAEVKQLEGQVQTYNRQFPRSAELGEFIRQITQIGQRFSIREWKYQPQAPRKTDKQFELPIQMHFEGEFTSAASFLREVEEMPRLTRVKKMTVKSKDSRAGIVEIDATVSIYFSER